MVNALKPTNKNCLTNNFNSVPGITGQQNCWFLSRKIKETEPVVQAILWLKFAYKFKVLISLWHKLSYHKGWKKYTYNWLWLQGAQKGGKSGAKVIRRRGQLIC